MPGADGYGEEGRQRVGNAFRQQAHDVDVPARFRKVLAPCSLVCGTDGAFVRPENRHALIDVVKHSDRVDVSDGWPHSAWTADQVDSVIERSITLLAPCPSDSSEDRCSEFAQASHLQGGGGRLEHCSAAGRSSSGRSGDGGEPGRGGRGDDG